ncbi:hypothetical protein BDW02DRAFT_555181 [Decorospora gaudefroyi]|uniref:Rhodopsin domain-containing protein n=1 Tax=Decorospora gaudefroyi TaxID=184978 RepID=A0A6A5KAW1_9PLEO|nr:hypothetical protein BDW02DRAFT_555181 [Decorospora gaudefroyi]
MGAAFADNPRGEHAILVSSLFTALALVVFALRLYTRVYLIRCAGIEEYGVGLAMVCSIGLTFCIGAQAKHGLGRHINDLDSENMVKMMKSFWASIIVYYLALGLTKGSILLQYRRIFTTRKFQLANWGVMLVVIAYTIWTVFSSIFVCLPVRAFWTREVGARCLNQSVLWFTNAGLNIATDFAIIILPIPVIRNLKLGQRQRIGLIAIFTVGGSVCIVSILRLQSLVQISNSKDPTYDNTPAATWSAVEVNVGIICSCLPLLRPLLTRWLPTAFPSRRRSIPSLPDRAPTTYGKGSKIPEGYDGKEGSERRSICSRGEAGEGDIQVVTDIRVEIERCDGRPCGVWSGGDVEGGGAEWSARENGSVKGLGRASSTEMLVEGGGGGRATP